MRYDETVKSYRKTYIHPLGLVQRSRNKIELIAISDCTVVAIPVVATEYKESAYGSTYNYMSGYDVTRNKYEVKEKRRYCLLSGRDEEILFHYKWDGDFASTEAINVIENVIEAMQNNLTEPPKGFTLIKKFNDQVINLMVDENASLETSISHLVESQDTHIQIHENNLEEAEMLLMENLRLYKIWRSE